MVRPLPTIHDRGMKMVLRLLRSVFRPAVPDLTHRVLTRWIPL